MSSLAVLRPGEPLAAVPSIGRAVGVEPRLAAREADVTHALYERHARQIYSYCLHQLSSREEAEDAVQTTFMNAFRGLKRGIVPEAEQAWLFKIAENVCLSRRRSTWRRGRVESPNDLEVLQEIVPSRGSRADELIGLEAALEAMPENQRRAILLREWQGLSYREIAEELAISQAAVETLIFRARRTLAHGLEDSPKRRALSRSANGLSAGSLFTALKSALAGGAAVKAAAVVVVAGTATVAATHAPNRIHLRHTHAARAVAVHVDMARPTKTSAGASVGRSADAKPHARAASTPALRRRSVAAPVTVAHVGNASPTLPPVAPPSDPPTAPPPTAPTDPPAVAPTAPAEAPAPPVEQAGKPDSPHGNAYGHDKKAADQPAQTPPAPSTADKPAGDNGNGNANGKKKDAPPAPAAPPAVPEVSPSAAAPPATPADAQPSQADEHGNGHGDDNAHGAGKDKGK